MEIELRSQGLGDFANFALVFAYADSVVDANADGTRIDASACVGAEEFPPRKKYKHKDGTINPVPSLSCHRS